MKTVTILKDFVYGREGDRYKEGRTAKFTEEDAAMLASSGLVKLEDEQKENVKEGGVKREKAPFQTKVEKP